MALTPEVQNLLAMVYRSGAPQFHQLTVEQARHSFQKLLYAFRPDAPAVASTLEVPIPRPDGSALLSRLYRPITRQPTEFLPAMVFLHGGGWCIGDVDSYDVFCRELSNASGCALLSVDYRLAPEYPFPHALDDAVCAYRWLIDNAAGLRIDADRIAVGGDSAGGNVSIVLALDAANRTLPAPRHLMLVYPCTEIISDRPSRQRFANGYFLDLATLEWFFSRYLANASADDWRVSPMNATTLDGLPSISLLTAEYDPLTDDCIAFSARAREHGCEVAHLNVDGVIHGFVTLGKLIPEARRAVTWLGQSLNDALAS